MAKLHPVFNHTVCIRCGTCAKYCPMGSITMTYIFQGDEKPYPEQTGRACLSCGLCAMQCPAHAIEMAAGQRD